MVLYHGPKREPGRIIDQGQAAQVVSAYYAVFLSGEQVLIANPVVSGRMPAIGVALGYYLSGQTVVVQLQGAVSNAVFSGLLSAGLPVFVLSGGFLGAAPPSVSGAIVQRMGTADTNGSLTLSPSPDYYRVGQ